MGLMDFVNVNYKQVFNGIMQSQEAQGLMADFVNHCLLHCEETKECLMDILAKDETFNKLIDESIEKNIKKSKMKSEFFN